MFLVLFFRGFDKILEDIIMRSLSKPLKNNTRNMTQESRGGCGRKRRKNNKLLMIISSRFLSESLKNNAKNKIQESRGGVEGRKKKKTRKRNRIFCRGFITCNSSWSRF